MGVPIQASLGLIRRHHKVVHIKYSSSTDEVACHPSTSSINTNKQFKHGLQTSMVNSNNQTVKIENVGKTKFFFRKARPD